MNVEQIKKVMSEISFLTHDPAQVSKEILQTWFNVLNESLLKTPQMKDAEDAALFRALAGRAWEFKTSFDKESQPTLIRAVFKIKTQTSDVMVNQIRTLVHDFGKNAEALDERLKK